ncbi:hypothetical protein D3C84_875660 [compost metagenome]
MRQWGLRYDRTRFLIAEYRFVLHAAALDAECAELLRRRIKRLARKVGHRIKLRALADIKFDERAFLNPHLRL